MHTVVARICDASVLFQIIDCIKAEVKFGISTADLRGGEVTYAHSSTPIQVTKKREQTITSSGSSLSQAKSKTAHGASSSKVLL